MRNEGHTETLRAAQARLAWHQLMRATEVVRGQLARALAFRRLTMSQFAALEAVRREGPLCQSQIAARLCVSNGNVTTVVDNLQKRGLVVRRRSETDRRYVRVHLTREGAALIDAISPHHAALLRDLMEVLAPEEMDQLTELCQKLEVEAA